MLKNSKKIKLFEPYFDNSEKKNIISVINSGWVTNGPKTQKFEEAFSRNKFLGNRRGLGESFRWC